MKQLLFAIVLTSLLAACGGTLDVDVEATPTESVMLTPTLAETSTPEETPTSTAPATMTATPAPTATAEATEPPPTSGATFRNLRFSITGDGLPQPTFPFGTEEVFAVWDYVNMTAEGRIRRVWTKDGEPWLERAEAWDFGRYGSAGTVRDLSVFDFEGSGLEPAFYELALYINDQLQATGTFVIRPETPQASSGGRLARVEGGETLILEDGQGNVRELLRAEAIVELQWLPDGPLLMVEEVEPADPSGPPWPDYVLWSVDPESGEQVQLSPPDRRVRRIAVAPGGGYVSALAGTDFGDACGMDRSLLFLDLTQPDRWLEVSDFDSVLNERRYGFFPADAGRWVSDQAFEVNMTAYCMTAEMGTPPEDLALLDDYRFDLESMTAVRR
ncbi:MAG: hypothetical protein R3300_09310 [Candidatus Promineifilaceae bacterium]|nr:hypothetical protein [Candidatus Promineifilaceae bacterium]